MSLQEVKNKLTDLKLKVEQSLKGVRLDEKNSELEELYKKQADPELYNDVNKMKTLNMDIKKLENIVRPWESLNQIIEDLDVLHEMASEDSDPDSYLEELTAGLQKSIDEFEKLDLLQLFKEDTDFNNSYISFNAGAGGTESCDWASMLYRMFVRWIEDNDMKYSVIDYQAGDEAGIKSATLFVEGDYAYGHLKAETGVHRLVRISPFDSNKRRHTSFCAVFATAEIDDDVDVEDVGVLIEVAVDEGGAVAHGLAHLGHPDRALNIMITPNFDSAMSAFGMTLLLRRRKSRLQR